MKIKILLVIVVLITLTTQNIQSQTNDTIVSSSQARIKEMNGITVYVDYLLAILQKSPTASIPLEDQKSLLKYLSSSIKIFISTEEENAALKKENEELKAKLKLLEDKKQ